MSTFNQTAIWKTLQHLQQQMQTQHLRELFAQQPDRYQAYSLATAGLTLDFSKNLINDTILTNLVALAEEANVSNKIQQFFHGDEVNFTEHRAAQHMALRDVNNFTPEVAAAIKHMEQLAKQVVDANIKYVVNLGIGGSDLGPALVVDALRPYHSHDLKFYFVSNVDPSAINDVLAIVEPEKTLFIIASKTFTTQETLANALAAKKWLLKHHLDFSKHMIAITTKPDVAEQFGIKPENILQFWSWVGGRYSLWSSIGFAIVLAVGVNNFKKLLTGAHQMDQHFLTSPLQKNMPVIMGLLTVWYVNFWRAQTQAIIPYDQHLQLLPAYLQQLIMESNGKSARVDGSLSAEPTSPVIWGQVGTNGQHAFHQLLHQGTLLIPIDFILPIQGHDADLDQQKLLVANCIAQSEALMVGKDSDDMHKYYSGNRPSNTLLMAQLTPSHLGALIALYEHKTFVESVIWHINAFDQWGVELGKQLAQDILTTMQDPSTLAKHDASTQAQVKFALTIKH